MTEDRGAEAHRRLERGLGMGEHLGKMQRRELGEHDAHVIR